MARNKKKRKRRSNAWNFFTTDENEIYAKCNLCKDEDYKVKIDSGATSSMIRHLETIHPEEWGVQEEEKTIGELPFKSIEEMVSLLAAKNGIPFDTIAKCEVFEAMCSKLNIGDYPATGTTVREMMFRFYEQKKEEIKSEIQIACGQSQKLAVSLDEWTSIANKRYLNVSLHRGATKWNLGLQKITGSFTAEACLQEALNKLEDFNITLGNVSCFITDGAPVMIKFGRISGRRHLQCMAHGIHLAVTDVFYNRPSPDLQSTGFEIDHMHVDEDKSDDDCTSEEELEGSLSIGQDSSMELKACISDIIKKTRKIVQLFRNSSKNTHTLQKNIPPGCKKEQLSHDVKIRWNSMLEMLERVLDLKIEIQKALIELNEPLKFTDEDFCLIENIVACLQPVKAAAEAICQQDATLISCDASIAFMMDHLASHSDSLSQEMLEAVKRRVFKRRDELYDVLHYLHYGNADSDSDIVKLLNKTFEKKAKKDITDAIKRLASQILPQDEANTAIREPSQGESCVTELEMPAARDLKLELSLVIKKALETPSVARKMGSSEKVLIRTIRNEMATFEGGGNRGKILESIYQILFNIPPSSVECERVFSTANYFCSKIRSRLRDDTLDALVFLKYYFKSKKK